MRAFAILAALALAACSGAEEADEPVAVETAAAPAAVMAADGQPPEGTYEITDQDGNVTTQVVSADGTYVTTDAEGLERSGTWTLARPDYWCQTESGGEQECFNETVVDGVWTSVNEADPEDTGTIVRVE